MKPDQITQKAVEKESQGATEKVGVVFVHGVGEQTESETVREFGGALLGWLQEWHKRRDDQRVEVTTSQLTYGENDERPARFAVSMPHQKTWVLAEAWWASRLSPPSFARLLTWGWRVLWESLERLGANTRERYALPADEPLALRFLSAFIGLLLVAGLAASIASGEIWLVALGFGASAAIAVFLKLLIEGSSIRAQQMPPPKKAAQLPRLHRLIGFAAAFYLNLGLGLGIVVAYPLLAVLFLLAQIPISQIQEFILYKAIRFFAVSRLGDVYAFMYDDVQAVHIRNAVPYTIRYLVKELGCTSIVVVAHSQGTVVAYDALSASPSITEIG